MRSWSGQLSLAPRCPDVVNAYVLTAGTAQAVTVPSGANWASFSAPVGIDFFVRYSSTNAEIPSSNITDGSACEQNPGSRNISGVTAMSIISASNCIITIAFYM